MNPDRPDIVAQDPHAELEQSLIAEFLHKHGHTMKSVEALAPEQADALLKEACSYASGRLCEVESRAHYVQDLHQKP
jgi:hypothetical protein